MKRHGIDLRQMRNGFKEVRAWLDLVVLSNSLEKVSIGEH